MGDRLIAAFDHWGSSMMSSLDRLEKNAATRNERLLDIARRLTILESIGFSDDTQMRQPLPRN